jgi:uncharacterized RDD family membrane protein YckC
LTAASTTQPPLATARYAGFWIRVLAFLIDAIVIGMIVSALTVGRAGVVTWDHWVELATWRNFVDTAASFVYFTVLWSAITGGQTLGMRLLNLRVVDADGQPISYGTAVLRWIGMLISAAVILLGFIWVAFDARKQGWHDKIASTYVIHDHRGRTGAPSG